MSAVTLGMSGAHKVRLDVDVLLRTRLLAQANSGQGKSFLLRRLAEQLFGKVQLIIVDPEGEFATLREKFDFILIGEGGDAPIHVPSARLLAHRLLELRASAICNIYDGVLPQARHEWVRSFLDGLIDSPKKLWHPCVVMVDEAHKFAPERKAGESCALEAMTRLASDGRKRGFAAVFATQRLAKLDKSVSAELLNRLVGGTFEDVDIDRALDLLSVSKADTFEFKKSLKVLEPGEFYAIGRAITKERLLLKVGPVETRHPDSGAYGARTAEPPPPTAKVRELLSKLEDLPRAAEQKAQTEKELKGEIQELRRQLRTAARTLSSASAAAPALDPRTARKAEERLIALQKLVEEMYKVIVEQKIWLEKHGEEITEQSLRMKGEATSVVETEKLLARMARQLQARMQALTDPAKRVNLVEHTSTGVEANGKPAEVKLRIEVKPKREAPDKTASPISNGDGSTVLTGPMKRVLGALGEIRSITPVATKEMVAGWAAYSPKGGSFLNTLGSLRTAGLINYPGAGYVELSEEGLALTGDPPRPSREEVRRRILSVCSGPERRILAVLMEDNREYTRADIAVAAGYAAEGGSFLNSLGALRTKGFIDYPRQGVVKPEEWLFLE